MNFKNKVKIFISHNEIFSKLEKYVELIEEKNKVMNLTGFTGDKLWEEGIYESLILLDKAFSNKIDISHKKLLDIGAGAGFPSVPFKIYKPEIELTIYEPIGKRVDFLNLVSQELDLNIKVVKTRSEDVKEKELFDFITARAVMDLKQLILVSHHLGKINSEFAFLKGPKVFVESENSIALEKELKITSSIVKVNTDNIKENYLFSFKKEFPSPSNFPKRWVDIINSNKEK